MAFEALVLIASILLLAYINKNQLSKWYKFAAMAIVAFVLGLMLCSVFGACRSNCGKGEMCGMKKECRTEMRHMKGAVCMRDMDRNGDCCEGKEMSCEKSNKSESCCSMKDKKDVCCKMGEMDDCCSADKKADCKKVCMIECKKEGKVSCKHGNKKDSILKEEVIIKK